MSISQNISKKYFDLKICGILRNLKKMQKFFGKDFTWFLNKKKNNIFFPTENFMTPETVRF